MLHKEAVDASVLELIVSLQKQEYLKGFFLVGGTALALHLGHRKSDDIDLFSNFDFDATQLQERIHMDYTYKLLFAARNTLKGSIDEIMVDFIAHRYEYIHEPLNLSGIGILSVQDIIAMMLNAVSTSGQRSKDFIDIFYLLKEYNLGEMLSFYSKKYHQENDSIVLKSLIYFDEVDLSDWPVLIKKPALGWDEVKAHLDKAVLEYIKQQS